MFQHLRNHDSKEKVTKNKIPTYIIKVSIHTFAPLVRKIIDSMRVCESVELVRRRDKMRTSIGGRLLLNR